MASIGLVATSICAGQCTGHSPIPVLPVTGIIINGSVDHTVEGSFVATVGLSLVACSCGHVAPIISTLNVTNFTNGLPKSSVGSVFSAIPTGTVITGSITAM
jgi:hypothetical protein